MTKPKEPSQSTISDTKSYSSPALKKYGTPRMQNYGDLRDLSKGMLAYSLEEGPYMEMNPPS